MKYRRQSNCIYYCNYHIVIVTKYRKKIINDGVFAYIKNKMKDIEGHYPEVYIKRMNHDKDHIHLLVSIPPKRSVGWYVRIVKANTARDMRKNFKFIREAYWGTGSVWSGGYFVSTVSNISEEVVKRYILLQGKEDSAQAKLELD